jgi:hypothetical protein
MGVRSCPSAWLTALAILLVACASEDKSEPLAPAFGDGKADVGDHVVAKGALGLGADAAVSASFVEDLEFHGYVLEVGAGAVVDLEVTHQGSSLGLDTTLYVYGPRATGGGYGVDEVAHDDDAGYGRLSRVKALALPAAGAYLVVVGTHDGQGRGAYRVQATCASASCAPAPVTDAGACDARLADAIRACVTDRLADPDFDPYAESEVDVIEACADPEVVAPAWDELCSLPDAPADVCGFTMEGLTTAYLPGCSKALVDEALDRTCVFGLTYREIFDRPGAVVIVAERVLTAASPLTELERAQIVKAVTATAHDDATTAEAAFAVVDDQRINQTELWDASNRVAVTGYEMGAGDNSFGMLFAAGTTDVVAHDNDGDLSSCTLTWGPERRRCTDDADCAPGLRCTGKAEVTGRGRCIATAADTDPALDRECDAATNCPAGLVCAGAPTWGTGLCRPAWMQGRFVSEPALAIPDGQPAGVEALLLVEGLATVDVDVLLDLVVSHARPTDLKISLLNPAGTEVVIFDGASPANGEFYLARHVVKGFPGDEYVNGAWRLKVVDAKAGETGGIGLFGLTITSRWD